MINLAVSSVSIDEKKYQEQDVSKLVEDSGMKIAPQMSKHWLQRHSSHFVHL